MERDIHVRLDFFILTDTLKTDLIKREVEIDIDSYRSVITVNKLPFYEAKVIEDAELIVGRITKILTPEEATDIKERYAI